MTRGTECDWGKIRWTEDFIHYTVADSLNTWHVVTGDSAGEMFEKILRTHGMLLCRHDNIFISETMNCAGDVSM